MPVPDGLDPASPLGAALAALLDRARGQLTAADLPALGMGDPGTADYVAAYARVLTDGLPALLEPDAGGRRLLHHFDIRENLLLSHTDAARSGRHRWFSILTGCIELLDWHDPDHHRAAPAARMLGQVLTDSFALEAAGDPDAPVDLLPALTAALQETEHQHRHALAVLAALLVGPRRGAAPEAACAELHRCHDAFPEWVDADGGNNPWVARSEAFVWGAVLDHRADLARWLELVHAHCPSAPGIAAVTRARLLEEGARWRPRRR